MFTGLVEDVGTVESVSKSGEYIVVTVHSILADETMLVGESIALDGACLTVVSHKSGSFVVEASEETVNCTVLGSYSKGRKINLERALKVGDRMGGHFVSGHIDARACVVKISPQGESIVLQVEYDKSFDKFVAAKGSVTISGVSLTINEVAQGSLMLNFIPHTIEITNLGKLSRGDEINIEFDILAKYVANPNSSKAEARLTANDLIESGW